MLLMSFSQNSGSQEYIFSPSSRRFHTRVQIYHHERPDGVSSISLWSFGHPLTSFCRTSSIFNVCASIVMLVPPTNVIHSDPRSSRRETERRRCLRDNRASRKFQRFVRLYVLRGREGQSCGIRRDISRLVVISSSRSCFFCRCYLSFVSKSSFCFAIALYSCCRCRSRCRHCLRCRCRSCFFNTAR